jgi:hypothetical protein
LASYIVAGRGIFNLPVECAKWGVLPREGAVDCSTDLTKALQQPSDPGKDELYGHPEKDEL